ncbi:MAG: alpha/beta hydrolase [Spirochaetales bacterium]|nr:alpha/beta hydrolase [Spirochaetales bacterium]
MGDALLAGHRAPLHRLRTHARFVGTAAALGVGVVLSTACSTTSSADRHQEYQAMRAELAPLQFDRASATPAIRSFYAECIAGVDGARHDTGTFPSLDMNMAAHVFYPGAAARGTVFVVHGYLAHPIQLAPLIRGLVLEGYVVVAPELPGHALSDGPRGGIGDFSEYGVFLADVVDYVDGRLPRPWHAVGHSTGATAIYEFLRDHTDPFEAVVFAAPLVRSHRFVASRAARAVTRPFISTVRTGYDGPLGMERMPLSWFDAQVEWNARKERFEALSRTVLVLQGTDDRVVDWRYNRVFLSRAIPAVEYVMVDGAEHVIYRGGSDGARFAVDRTILHINACRR